MEIVAGFIMGILGSFHCLGMCGPIALAIPPRSERKSIIAVDSLLYNFGRTATYTIMGALVGIIGASLSLAGYQETISVIAGIALLAVVVFPKKWENSLAKIRIVESATEGLKKLFGKIIGSKTAGSMMIIGLLNGLLPCGLVYVALTASIASGTIAGAAMFMFFFGIGTIPMMASLFILKSVVSIGVRRRINKLIPAGIVVVAVILILRGMALGIPYISPVLPDHVKEKPKCCHSEEKSE